MRLLDVLLACLKENIRCKPFKYDTRDNQALDLLALKAARFLTRELKKVPPSLVGPHQPLAETEAFNFVKVLVIQLDDTVTDDEIIGALRAANWKLKRPKGYASCP